MTVITRTANFEPADTADRILDDIACPCCGYRDEAETYRLSLGHKLRFFCDGCGAFVTILLNTLRPRSYGAGRRSAPGRASADVGSRSTI
jgi:hypothetical protein